MKKFVLNFIYFFLLLSIITYLIGLKLDSYQRQIPSNKLTWLFQIKDSTFDDAFLGSSRTYMMFNHNIWFEKTGKTAINLGIDGSGMADHYLTLYQFLKNGNKIKRLFLHIDQGTIKNNFTYPFRDYIWSLYVDDPEIKNVLYYESQLYDFVVFRLHPFGKYLKENRKYPFGSNFLENKISFDSLAGTYYNDIPFRINYERVKTYKYENFEISKSFQRNFENLMVLAHQNSIEVIIYTAPVHPAWAKYLAIAKTTHYLDSLTQSHSLKWINFYSFEMKPDSVYHRDITHLNSEGTKLFTTMIADSMRIIY